MRRNCNLELRLLPPSASYNVEQLPMLDTTTKASTVVNEMRRRQQQQITIFYDRKVVACDVTELQARAIILLASQAERTKTRSISEPSSQLINNSSPSSSSSSSQLYSPTDGLSMKRSLQGFLQKRKNRLQATSPYHR